MTWKYHKPEFEFSKDTPSSWWGHVFFAYDLVANIKPKRIVELGTHYGVSFFSMCQAAKDLSLNIKLHAVDTWLGDAHAKAGYEEKDLVYNEFKKSLNFYCGNLEINLHRKLFDEALKDFSENSIDLLHIDGYHTYDAVKHDFESWLPKMKKAGIILLHDIHERKENFGVYKLWEEIKEKYDTLEFYHWHGLGVVFLEKEIKSNYFSGIEDEIKGTYSNIADGFLFGKMKEKKKAYRVLSRKIGAGSVPKKPEKSDDEKEGQELLAKKGKLLVKKNDSSNARNKIAVYTAIFGGYDHLTEPKEEIKGCDFYCFTDNEKLESNLFKIVNVEGQYSDPTRNARKIKTLAHEYLPDYEYTLWIDGNINFREFDVEKMFSDFLAEHDVAIHRHNVRECVFDEFAVCAKLELDSVSLMSEQIMRYLKEGYPINNGLAETSVVFRRNTDLSKKINEDWWNEIKDNSRRDQLSIDYVFWKNKAEYYKINESVRRGKYFFVESHKSNSYAERTKKKDFNELERKLLRVENDSRSYIVNKLKKENAQKDKTIQQIINSKPYSLGNLFLRSIKKPWKILTFPINAYKILNNKKQKNAKS